MGLPPLASHLLPHAIFYTHLATPATTFPTCLRAPTRIPLPFYAALPLPSLRISHTHHIHTLLYTFTAHVLYHLYPACRHFVYYHVDSTRDVLCCYVHTLLRTHTHCTFVVTFTRRIRFTLDYLPPGYVCAIGDSTLLRVVPGFCFHVLCLHFTHHTTRTLTPLPHTAHTSHTYHTTSPHYPFWILAHYAHTPAARLVTVYDLRLPTAFLFCHTRSRFLGRLHSVCALLRYHLPHHHHTRALLPLHTTSTFCTAFFAFYGYVVPSTVWSLSLIILFGLIYLFYVGRFRLPTLHDFLVHRRSRGTCTPRNFPFRTYLHIVVVISLFTLPHTFLIHTGSFAFVVTTLPDTFLRCRCRFLILASQYIYSRFTVPHTLFVVAVIIRFIAGL